MPVNSMSAQPDYCFGRAAGLMRWAAYITGLTDQLTLNGYSEAADERLELTYNVHEHKDQSFLAEPEEFLEADSRFHGVSVQRRDVRYA